MSLLEWAFPFFIVWNSLIDFDLGVSVSTLASAIADVLGKRICRSFRFERHWLS